MNKIMKHEMESECWLARNEDIEKNPIYYLIGSYIETTVGLHSFLTC